MRVQKRNGTEVEFDSHKIINAITKASCGRLDDSTIESIAHIVKGRCAYLNRMVKVEEIQDLVE